MKKKLTLSDLKVQSFVTSEENLSKKLGGANSDYCYSRNGSCLYFVCNVANASELHRVCDETGLPCIVPPRP